MKKSKLDFDPESLIHPAPSSNDDHSSDFSSEEEEDAGREHYADVAKSKLRKKEVVPLGPQYTGSKIRREDMEDEDSDDPFARTYDIDESEDEDGNEMVLNGNGSTHSERNGVADEKIEDEDEELDDEDDHNLEMDGEDDDDISDINNISDEEDDEAEDVDAEQTSELREMMKSQKSGTVDRKSQVREMMRDQKAVTAVISQGAKADIEKGQAVKTQRATFDSLLNMRIKLQKALISTNSMAAETYSEATAPEDAFKAAEAAALTLLNNLTELRMTLDSSRTGEKRKRTTTFTNSVPSSDIFASLQDDEAHALSHRKAVLEKWNLKTRGAAINTTKSRLTGSSTQQTLTDVLSAQLQQDSTRLIERTRTPRSCAPLQSASKAVPSKEIYDDADFYGLLLKELLEHRSAASTGAAEFVVQQPWQVAREAKTKRVVDTKASKGRKLRYTVHEKLQNFMPPEERNTWEARQREELFASLFGRRMGLGEDVESEAENSDEEDPAGEGLMLFRS